MRRTRSRCLRLMIRSQSRHSARAVRTKRSANAFASEDGVEVAGELAVAVADQEPKRWRLFLECPSELACLLGDPASGRVGGDAGQVDASAFELDEEEHIRPL